MWGMTYDYPRLYIVPFLCSFYNTTEGISLQLSIDELAPSAVCFMIFNERNRTPERQANQQKQQWASDNRYSFGTSCSKVLKLNKQRSIDSSRSSSATMDIDRLNCLPNGKHTKSICLYTQTVTHTLIAFKCVPKHEDSQYLA